MGVRESSKRRCVSCQMILPVFRIINMPWPCNVASDVLVILAVEA